MEARLHGKPTEISLITRVLVDHPIPGKIQNATLHTVKPLGAFAPCASRLITLRGHRGRVRTPHPSSEKSARAWSRVRITGSRFGCPAWTTSSTQVPSKRDGRGLITLDLRTSRYAIGARGYRTRTLVSRAIVPAE